MSDKRFATQEEYDACVLLYSLKGQGQDAVLRLAREQGVNVWKRCEPCDALQPQVAATDGSDDGYCLVCGS